MSTLYQKAVELLVDDIQNKALKEKIEVLGEKAEMAINEHSDNTFILQPNKYFNSRLINASVPLTRRERRALKRKEKKYEETR